MLNIFEQQGISLLLVSGDIFENSTTTLWELLVAYDFFKKAGSLFPVICTTGNHDELQKGHFQDEYLRLLNIPNVTFVSKPQVVTLTVSSLDRKTSNPVSVGAIPWTGIKDQNQFNEILEPIFTDKVEIGMLHECFKGIVTDTGYRPIKGIQVPDIPTVRYFACGDIHVMQRLNLPHAWMSGAPLQQNFGDKPGKGCLVVEAIQGGEYAPTFHKIPSHIELHQISDIKEIPENSPHWYQLKCEPNKIPLALPHNVVSVEPLPIKIDIPTNMEKESPLEADKPYLNIDYAEGVDSLLQEMGYSESQIDEEMKFIREQVK
jgi:DNA repair exonuclease SbcCD nuclease subunit